MTDPIQPADDWHVHSVEELQNMTPFFRNQYVKKLAEYVASVDRYVPLLPQRRLDRISSDVRSRLADAWDEGYRQAARDELIDGEYGIAPWQLEQNPYRSES